MLHVNSNPHMMRQNRDITLDYIRSLACILMMCIHTYTTAYAATEYFRFFASYTAAIFFSISGYLAMQQSRRNRLSHIIILYLTFIVLGFAYNGIMPVYYFPGAMAAHAGANNLHPDGLNFFSHVECEIIQAVALGSILVAAASKIFKDRYYVYLLACLAIFALYKFLAFVKPEFIYRSFFIAPGVFPPIPWAAYAFLGAFAYSTLNRNNMLLLIVSLLACFIVYFGFHYGFEWSNISDAYIKYKFSMSNWYMLISFVVLFFVYYIFRLAGSRLHPGEKNVFLFFGQNSMLFLFIHYIISYYLMVFHVTFFVFTWSALFILTYIVMRLLIRLDSKIKARMYNPALWVLLAILIFATPLLLRSNLVLIVHIELLYGIVFSLRYRDLSYRIKNFRKEPADAGAEAESSSLPIV